MMQEKDKFTFTFDLLKQSRPAVKSPVMELCSFPENLKICVVRTWSRYLKRTQSLREQETQLFLTYQKPYHAVRASTLRRWIMSMLKLAGVDTTRFSAHSTRSASSCAASRAGGPLVAIHRTGGSSSEQTFPKHYCVPIQHKNTFSEAIHKA